MAITIPIIVAKITDAAQDANAKDVAQTAAADAARTKRWLCCKLPLKSERTVPPRYSPFVYSSSNAPV